MGAARPDQVIGVRSGRALAVLAGIALRIVLEGDVRSVLGSVLGSIPGCVAHGFIPTFMTPSR
jgi:hypothetical protein